MVKFIQSRFIEFDIELYEPRINKPTKCNNNTIHEDLGLVIIFFQIKPVHKHHIKISIYMPCYSFYTASRFFFVQVGLAGVLAAGLPAPLAPPLPVFASAIDQFSGALRETDLAAVRQNLKSYPRGLAVLGVGNRQIR